MGLMILTVAAVLATPLVTLTGNWKGNMSSSMRDSYTRIVMTIRQLDDQVKGRVACHHGTMDCHAPTADVRGVIEDREFVGRVLYADGHLCGLVGTLSGQTLEGEYSCNDALGKDRGHWKVQLDLPGSE